MPTQPGLDAAISLSPLHPGGLLTRIAAVLAVAILACFAISKSLFGLAGMALLFTLSPPAFIALLVVMGVLFFFTR
jgi:hypothetical protein